jgi:dihydrofolate reductase
MQSPSTTRKVVLYELLSLDGVAEEPGDWFFDTGPEVLENLGRTIATQGDVLLGRGTYDYWAGHWPTADLEPFASFINSVPKHVFTSAEADLAWSNSRPVRDPAVDYVAAMKQQGGRDVGIHGSIMLTQSLLRAELVDELRLVVSPVLAGRGRRLFPDASVLQRMRLDGVERSRNGTLFLAYSRTP